MEGAECWLEKVRGDLMAANSVPRTRAVDTRPAGASSLLQISVERPPPSQNAIHRLNFERLNFERLNFERPNLV